MKEIELKFYGYTWEEYAFQISSLNGIYVIYKGRLDAEGLIDIKDVLYVGYHKGIIELYEEKIIESIKHYITPSDHIFLSYAEAPSSELGRELASMIVGAVHPKHVVPDTRNTSNIKIIFCKGNCKLLPEIIERQ